MPCLAREEETPCVLLHRPAFAVCPCPLLAPFCRRRPGWRPDCPGRHGRISAGLLNRTGRRRHRRLLLQRLPARRLLACRRLEPWPACRQGRRPLRVSRAVRLSLRAAAAAFRGTGQEGVAGGRRARRGRCQARAPAEARCQLRPWAGRGPPRGHASLARPCLGSLQGRAGAGGTQVRAVFA